MRLNLGCGAHPLEGWKNVDLHLEADIRGDVRDLTFEGVEAVEMAHLLEHLPWADTFGVLTRIRSWMVPGGEIRVEVPDWETLAEMDPADPMWAQWVWGSQVHPGEFHTNGFTEATLRAEMARAGWTVTGSARFRSTHDARPGYPCVEVRARA